ncbi:MAG: ribonuclease P protein component [Phascolarctobacterium faecium]|uniref:ribonuclease P protein component n=1 Tax=Phascolarctobacterium faecium TaxID=33025 RepID=UPI003999C837
MQEFGTKKKSSLFLKKNRIKSKAGFQLVYTTGRSVVDSLSVLYVLPLDAEGPKIGFAVGKKIGNAVVRNRVKRMMREVFRHHKSELLTNIQLIWVARKKLAAADLKTYDRVFMRLAKRAVLLK